MKCKKIILTLALIAITLIPSLNANAVTLPWFTIVTHNYSKGDKVTFEEYSEVAAGESLQLYGMMVYASTMYNDNYEIVDSGTFVSDNNLSGVTWSSNNQSIATVDNTGKVTGVKEGETSIKAEYNGESKEYKIKVTPKKSIFFTRTTPESAKIINKEYNFFIILDNIPVSEKENINIKIDNEKIAKITEIDLNYEGGLGKEVIMVKTKLLSLGSTTITATLNYNGETYSDSYDFTVTESAYYLQLSAKDYTTLPTSIAKGKQIQLKVERGIYGGSILPEDVTDKGVIWETSNEKIATVDNKGLVTAIEEGEAIITAKYKIDDETITTTYKFNITATNDTPLTIEVPNTAAENTKYFYIIGFLMIFLGGVIINNNLSKNKW